MLLISLARPFPVWAEAPVKLAYCDYRPFYFKGASGEARGIVVDFWKLWSDKTGIPVEYLFASSWKESVAMIENGLADINPAIFYTPEREKFLDFTLPLFDAFIYIFYHIDIEPPKKIADIKDLRVGVVKDDYSDQFLKKSKIKLIQYYDNYENLVKAGIGNEIDAFLMSKPVATAYLAKHNGLKVIYNTDIPVYKNSFLGGIKKGRQDFLDRINRGISAISREEINAIMMNWTGQSKTGHSINYPEKITIASCDDHIPFYFIDKNGAPRGLIIDIWKLWSRKTGIKVAFKSYPFTESVERVKNGEIKIHSGCFYSKTRDQYLDYAAFLTNSNTHFFFHESIYGVKNLEDLCGFKIGVMAKDFAIEFVKKKLPDSVMAEYPSNQALYKAVKAGEIRVFVGDTVTALSYLARMGILDKWRYHAERPMYNKAFYAAVAEGEQRLFSMVKEGMQAISSQERAAIERNWIGCSNFSETNVLKIACPMGNAPYSMLNSKGEPAGLFVDMWRLWAETTNNRVQFYGFTRDGACEAVLNGNADIHLGLHPSQSLMDKIHFSPPFYRFGKFFFYRKQMNPFSGSLDLADKRIGIIKGRYGALWFQNQFARAEIVVFDSDEVMVQDAASGKIDAFVAASPTILPVLGRLGLMEVFAHGKSPFFYQDVAMAVSKKNAALMEKIQTGFTMVDEIKMAEIETWWIADPVFRFFSEHSKGIVLSAKEIRWLETHKTMKMGVDAMWPPFEFINKKGKYIGMVSEYVDILEKRLNINLKLLTNQTWSEVLKQTTENPPLVDIIPCISPSSEKRKKDLLFTNPYLNYPWVVITRKDTPLIGDLRDLYGKTAVVVKEHVIGELLFRDHANIKLRFADSTKEALEMVSSGNVFACVGNLASASYQIQEKNITNLKIAASTSYGGGLSFGIRKDWPELVNILNKGLASITQQEHDQIRQKWFSIRFEHAVDKKKIVKIIVFCGAGVLVFLLLIMFWNRQIQKRAMELKKARDEARSANLAKSIFLAGLSHEIRTPLNAILGLTEITLKSGLSRAQMNNMKILKASAGHLSQLINDILDLSKIESGKIKLELINFNLLALINELEVIYANKTRIKGLGFHVEVDPELPSFVRADPVRLRQVLINLTDNALKFTNHGNITIKVNRCRAPEFTEQSDTGEDQTALSCPVTFTVQDTGIGFSNDKRKIIFEMFSQNKESWEKNYGGTGIGLSICKKNVELMGGEITVESSPGLGSLFSFTLNLEVVDQKINTDEEDRKQAVCAVQNLNILVAEDNYANAVVVRQFLENLGHVPKVVGNGKKALEFLKKETFHLLLMDLQMPEMDGLTAVQEIRKGNAGEKNKNIPVIAMTAHALEEYRNRSLAFGMNDFLTKPVEMDLLARAIDKNSGLSGGELLYSSLHPIEGYDREGDVCKGASPDIAEREFIDKEEALALMGGNSSLLQEVFSIFLQETPQIVDRFEASMMKNDMEEAFVAAHTIKGACDRIGAKFCGELAMDLQKSVQNSSLDPETLGEKISEFKKVFNELTEYIYTDIE